jgi:hypothetical protein
MLYFTLVNIHKLSSMNFPLHRISNIEYRSLVLSSFRPFVFHFLSIHSLAFTNASIHGDTWSDFLSEG